MTYDESLQPPHSLSVRFRVLKTGDRQPFLTILFLKGTRKPLDSFLQAELWLVKRTLEAYSMAHPSFEALSASRHTNLNCAGLMKT